LGKGNEMNWKSALSYLALGLSFGVLAQITKRYAMLDEVRNFCTIVGVALLLVGMHCVLFDSPVRFLPLTRNILLFALLSLSLNGAIVWNGAFWGQTWSEIVFKLANTGELTLLYAAFLLLPRIAQPKDRQVFSESAPSASSEKPSS
jgi:hypothetical protein